MGKHSTDNCKLQSPIILDRDTVILYRDENGQRWNEYHTHLSPVRHEYTDATANSNNAVYFIPADPDTYAYAHNKFECPRGWTEDDGIAVSFEYL